MISNQLMSHNVGTCNIVRAPIKAAGSIIRPRPTVAGTNTTDPTLTSFAVEWKHPHYTTIDLKPDWVIFDRTHEKDYREDLSEDSRKHLVYAVEDSKMCQDWQSAWIHSSVAGGHVGKSPPPSGQTISKIHDAAEEWLKTLAQVVTYCRFAQTRYSFLLTQEGLVALRVRRIDPGQISESIEALEKLHTAIEYKAVPWNASGAGQLTVNLAIWALGCMGTNENHREMEATGNSPLDSMVRLTKWTHDNTQKLYRNDISGREISEVEWMNMGSKTVIATLDDKSGDSLTSRFTQSSDVASRLS